MSIRIDAIVFGILCVTLFFGALLSFYGLVSSGLAEGEPAIDSVVVSALKAAYPDGTAGGVAAVPWDATLFAMQVRLGARLGPGFYYSPPENLSEALSRSPIKEYYSEEYRPEPSGNVSFECASTKCVSQGYRASLSSGWFSVLVSCNSGDCKVTFRETEPVKSSYKVFPSSSEFVDLAETLIAQQVLALQQAAQPYSLYDNPLPRINMQLAVLNRVNVLSRAVSDGLSWFYFKDAADRYGFIYPDGSAYAQDFVDNMQARLAKLPPAPAPAECNPPASSILARGLYRTAPASMIMSELCSMRDVTNKMLALDFPEFRELHQNRFSLESDQVAQALSIFFSLRETAVKSDDYLRISILNQAKWLNATGRNYSVEQVSLVPDTILSEEDLGPNYEFHVAQRLLSPYEECDERVYSRYYDPYYCTQGVSKSHPDAASVFDGSTITIESGSVPNIYRTLSVPFIDVLVAANCTSSCHYDVYFT